MQSGILTKRRWVLAVAGVVGAASGVAVYLWNRSKDDSDKSAFSIEVGPDIPDDLVTEARDAGGFAAGECGIGQVSVIGVCEFTELRVYTVMVGTQEYKVCVNNEGHKEVGCVHKATDEACGCACSE